MTQKQPLSSPAQVSYILHSDQVEEAMDKIKKTMSNIMYGRNGMDNQGKVEVTCPLCGRRKIHRT